ncbi:MAG TPA: hypothetical protein PLQ56_05070 [Aggregatilineales bacterium]|nr:hypothetical protein [Aggregatilineales bacterium]
MYRSIKEAFCDKSGRNSYLLHFTSCTLESYQLNIPADESAALDLIGRLLPVAEAKPHLRCWLQHLDSPLHSYRVDGKLVGLALPPDHICVVEPAHAAALLLLASP